MSTSSRKWSALITLAVALLFLSWATGRATGQRGSERPARGFDVVTGVPERAAEAWRPAQGEVGPDYGVVFMNSVEAPADAQQLANATATGASWDRWPIYWWEVERSPDVFTWERVDSAVQGDIQQGLQLNAILLGTPGHYQTDALAPARPAQRPEGEIVLSAPERATPDGLYEKIFSDGSDVPGPDKEINPANKWARFVFLTVNRYRPGSEHAQNAGWPAGAGITHWEMWNEPDLNIFWDSSVADFARLLKVGYLAAKQADPNSVILFGGLAVFEDDDMYQQVMAQYDLDPMAAQYNYYHDILAVHNYFESWRSWYYVWRFEQFLAGRGLSKPIWLNESGVPAWNDYPGPVWDPSSGLRATMAEQAAFVIQNALYATYAGADNIFHFQLYDGCGNQPAGTDFPPHDGSLCDENGRLKDNPDYPCAGDANGLFRNPTDAVCFRQHPAPETPRPHYEAFRVLTTHFRDVEPLWRLRPGSNDPANGPQEWMAFYRPATKERVLGLWARFGSEETAVVPATGSSAQLIRPDGAVETLTPDGGEYSLTLAAATNRNAFWDPTLYAIGGEPLLLIERDEVAPKASLTAIPFILDGGLYVRWQGDDGLGSGEVRYSVSVARDGAAAQSWIQDSQETDGKYPAEEGHSYTFTLEAADRAGNVRKLSVTVEAEVAPYSTLLPVMAKDQLLR